ncbi:MAG: hypothetical protein LAT62_07585 [Natronospirillum sp.]|uniref:hypothetical protein n=1 Tax=Natronospirillum sp. TaxID=2812955 RepID=UPI0025F17493|nr:hypothetical protein [Natronospirillum sp.]MCH8551781.1 hypothetical protein [Natronospirillum sp.]
MSEMNSLKETYNGMGNEERLGFLSGVRAILEGEMKRLGQRYGQQETTDRIRLIDETKKLQEAIHSVKDDSRESRRDPSLVQGQFWTCLEEYFDREND